MSKIQKTSFPSREVNLNFYCPFCGTHSMNCEGETAGCDHLLLIYLSIADPAVMHARSDLVGQFDDCYGWGECEEILKDNKDIGRILILEECEGGPAPSEIQVVYEHMDDDYDD